MGKYEGKEWWELFQEAFSTDESLTYVKCACGKEHYSVYDSGWTTDPSKANGDDILLVPEGERVVVRDYPIGVLKYNDQEFAWNCDCIEHNEELISTWEWINRNGQGLVKLIAMIRKGNADHHVRLLDDIKRIVNG